MLVYRSHPVSRFLLALAAVSMAVAGNHLLALAVSAVLVYWIDGSSINIRRAMSVMKWLVVPIILLHVLFGGGERIWPASGLPLSLDGLRAGIILSLMLATYYLMAMFISRLWRQREVLAMAVALPWAGRRLFPFLVSLIAIRSAVHSQLEQFRQQFSLRRQWSRAGLLLTTVLLRMFQISASCSQAVWLRWPENPPLNRCAGHGVYDFYVLMLASSLLAGGILS